MKISDLWKPSRPKPEPPYRVSDDVGHAEIKTLTGEVQALRSQLGELHSLIWGAIKNGDPRDVYVTSSHHFFRGGHFHDHYDEWRMRRIRKAMELCGSDFRGKRVLELGGGLGDIGAFFATLGAEVLSLEGRPANQQFANIRYRNLPGFKSVLCDLERDFSHFGRFDLVINFGLIEVMENIDNLMQCSSMMSDTVILETLVTDSTDPTLVRRLTMDPLETVDNPLYGPCARPSPLYVERFFEERGFTTRRAFDADLNTPIHIYDWEHDGVTEDRPPCKRRFWLFSKEDDAPAPANKAAP